MYEGRRKEMKKMKKEERCKNEEREEEKRSRSRAEDGEWKKTREIKKMFRFSGFLPMEIAPDEGQSRRKKKSCCPSATGTTWQRLFTAHFGH